MSRRDDMRNGGNFKDLKSRDSIWTQAHLKDSCHIHMSTQSYALSALSIAITMNGMALVHGITPAEVVHIFISQRDRNCVTQDWSLPNSNAELAGC